MQNFSPESKYQDALKNSNDLFGELQDSAGENFELKQAETGAEQAGRLPVKPAGLPPKTVMWSLAVLGCFSLIFGGLRWFTSLRIPFALEGQQELAAVTANLNKEVS